MNWETSLTRTILPHSGLQEGQLLQQPREQQDQTGRAEGERAVIFDL